MTDEVDPLIGKTLSGRFQILEPLGIGGMGKVYKAVQQPLDRVVALKVLNPRYDGSKDPGFEKRFFLEASMTAKLKHPNTVTVHDYGRTDDGIYFIAMEFIEGETLQHLLAREKRLPWQRALAIGGQVARSLREAHKLGLVHRDLKPANVMILREGTGGDLVKVLDFGLVKSFTPEPKGPAETELTQAGVLMGSPLYMAPEQARNEADQRTDIYALGVLMFQCIAGKPPFMSKDSIDVIVKHVKEAPPLLRSLVPEAPLEVEGIISRCLAKQPSARYQSMDELLDAFRTASAGQGLSGLFMDPRSGSGAMPRTASQVSNPAEPRVEAPRSLELEIIEDAPKRRNSRTVLVVALLALVGIGLGGFLATRVTHSPTPRPGPDAVKPPPKGPPTKLPPTEPPRVGTPTTPVEPATPVNVVFAIESEPSGATVLRDGKEVGTTPLKLSVARSGDAAAALQVVLNLPGFVPATVSGEGKDGIVHLSQNLKKKPAVRPPPGKRPNKNENGYKDDPYQ